MKSTASEPSLSITRFYSRGKWEKGRQRREKTMVAALVFVLATYLEILQQIDYLMVLCL